LRRACLVVDGAAVDEYYMALLLRPAGDAAPPADR
jgi:hypothetical protein